MRPILFVLAMFAATAALAEDKPAAPPIRLVIHGGAGAMSRAELTAEKEASIRADLERALRTGHAVLAGGGASLDAVTKAVVMLEDSPNFNAGRGAVFTHDGHNELDASVMEGHTRRAGSVAGLRRIKNPILLARAVMEKSPHVMLVGVGAEAFAESIGMSFVDPKYFRTKERWEQLQKALERERHEQPADTRATKGTVGAVALDRLGHLAAATSTGGMTNKRWGRVGDSPIVGAGTYADANCAVSATGWGEFFIRAAVAHDICARVKYLGESVEVAAKQVVMKDIPALGGDGGVIAIDSSGHYTMPFNTSGMYRGTIDADGRVEIAIFAGDAPHE